MAGGPEPYHDSYAVPVYMGDEDARLFVANVQAECTRLSVVLETVVQGGKRPSVSRIRGMIRRVLGM
jgi:hypothetical protein